MEIVKLRCGEKSVLKYLFQPVLQFIQNHCR